MKWKHRGAIQIIRHMVQLAAFILFPELFITVLQALGDVIAALVNGTFSIHALSAQLITIGAVLCITAVWGRFFCGYLCSFGAVQELLFWISKKIYHRNINLPTRLDHALQYLKYAVLVFIVAGLWILALPMDASISPWGAFGMLISGNLSVAAAAVHTAGFILLLALLAGSLFIERFFCRYFCPLGAVFTLISGKRCYKIQRNGSECTHCGLCERNCSMGISILEKDAVSSGKCVDCMQCLTVCPKECLSANPMPAAAGTTAAIAMCGLVQIGNLTVSEPITALGAYSFDQSETGNYIDGVYTGTGAGFSGDTEVQVTVENGYITDITVLSYGDDTEFFQKAQASILSQILSKQSIDVENVSGATFSSNGIIAAVADALGIENQEEGETEAQSAEQAAELSLSDGTYEGEGTGFRGATNVSVTVENGKITDITVVSYEDDDSFFNRAQDTIISEIIDSQSLDVSCVSGATFSSNGILEAVANALNMDFENPNQSRFDRGGHEKNRFPKGEHKDRREEN